MRHRLFRVVRFLLVALLVAEVCYVAAANAFLNLGGVEKALESTDDIRATYQRAWTLWPGRVHVENARILFQDHNLEWSLDAAELEIDLAFVPFFQKTLRATRVRGEGAVFRVRQRVVAADATLPSTRALPPIPEFPTPALVPAYVPAAPRTDLWKLHLENVDVGVVEIWAQQVRYLGSGRARGAFRLHAGHHLWVGPASLDLEPGELRASHRVLASGFHGHVDCVVHPFFVNVPVGREVFRHISANLDLHAENVRLEPLDLFLPPGTTLSSPGARLDLVVGTDHGVFTRQSHVELHGPELRGSHQGWVFRGSAFELGGRIGSDGLGEATFGVEHARASRNGKRDSRLELGAGHVALATSSVDTSAEWGLARVDVAFVRLEIPALVGFDELAKPRGVRLAGGSARIDASGRYSGGTISGEGRAFVSKGRGQAGGVGWEVDGSAVLSLGRAETEALSADRMDLAIQAGRLALTSAKTRVEAIDARLTAHARMTQGRGTGRVKTTVKKLSMTNGLLRMVGKAGVDIDLSAIDASRKTLRASASGELASLEVASGAGVRARARRLELKSELSLAKTKLSRGWLEVAIPALSIRTGDTAVSTDARLLAEVKDLDLANRRGSASSLLLIRDLIASDAVAGVKCQWMSVPRAALRTKLAFSPDGRAITDFAGEVDAVRARWDDFELSGNARVQSRYVRDSDVFTFDVDAKKLEMKSGSGKLEGWEAKIPELRVVSELRRDLGALSGPIRVRAKRVEGRIGRTPVHADLSADWRLAVLDFRRGEAIGSGDLRIDHAGLQAGGVRVDEWWGRVTIPLLSVVAKQNVDVLGEFRAKFRDGLPALGMFAASGDLPGWVPDLLPLHELEARGGFRRSCRTADIVIEAASGGPLAAAGRIQSTPSDTRGAFLIQLQSPLPVSVGLVTYDDEVGVAILAGNDWLKEQSEILDQWALVTSCKPGAASCKIERRAASD